MGHTAGKLNEAADAQERQSGERLTSGPVLVAGGINADVLGRTLTAPALHTSNPALAGVTPGGVARNIAEQLARLLPAGALIRLLGAVGSDVLGAGVIDATARAGVDVSGVLRLPGQTGIYMAVLDEAGELHIGLAAMQLTEALTPDVISPWLAALDQAAMLIVDANLPPQTVAALLGRARQAGVQVIIEPVSGPKAARLAQALGSDWNGAFLVTPDQAELEAMTGQTQVAAAARTLLDGGVQNVLVTLSKVGSILFSDGRIPLLTPATEARVRDVTGAGDALVAGLCAALVRGWALPEAVKLGHACAALTVASAQSVPEGLSWATATALLDRAWAERKTVLD